MIFDTRLKLLSDKGSKGFRNKFKFIFLKFTSSLFFLFLGFLIGNLFGTLVGFFREFLWDGFIIVSLLLFFEAISYCHYKFLIENNTFSNFPIKTSSSVLDSRNLKPRISFFKFLIKRLNYLKLGVLLGFFIDAFKVGS
uniref:Hypothetical chloroplast RF20 n=1 Tax=Neodangemannia microcystis TaxID=173495 RepID=A0A1W6EHB9_9CHLO|nr:hypothetical chloroplast RF20 [Neodangemannia microcystis]ARK14799.1 hypothetical chloroplast RF20 [Neodangemannia microcystis]